MPVPGTASPAPAMTATTAAASTTSAAAAGAGVATGSSAARGMQQLLAGGVAGAVSKTLVAPLERVSTMLMADAKRFSVGQAAAHAWRDGLYRGHAATLLKIFPASAIQFAVFNGVKDRILAARVRAQLEQQQQRRPEQGAGLHPPHSSSAAPAQAATAAAAAASPPELENHERLLAGAAAGAAAACACYPLESMRTAMSGERAALDGWRVCEKCTVQPAVRIACST